VDGGTLNDDISVLNGAVNGKTAPADSLRDAEADKVRGTQGRSVNKKKGGPNIKHVKKGMSLLVKFRSHASKRRKWNLID
jgi:hypothetical protein